MKFLFTISVFFSLASFCQENPWENKNKENPWGNYPSNETSQEKETTEPETIDTLQATIESDTILKVETLDAIDANQDVLVRSAELDTKENYRSGRDFAFGFASGLLLNGYGTLADLIYTIPTTKAEDKAMEKVKTDSTYSTIEDKRLNDRTKRAVKSKKFLSALGGTIAGSFVQFGILIGYSIYS